MSKSGQSLEFRYDYMGRRVQKKVWASATFSGTLTAHLKFAYQGMELVAELDSSGNMRKSFHWGVDRSSTRSGAGGAMGLLMWRNYVGTDKSYYPSYDLSGNLTGLLDSGGNYVAWYEYDGFGRVMAEGGTSGMENENPIRFSTKYADDETGLVYYGFRFYDPSKGRFLNRDPIGESGGLNLYRFANNNPVSFVDLFGLSAPGDPKYTAGPDYPNDAPPPGESNSSKDNDSKSESEGQDPNSLYAMEAVSHYGIMGYITGISAAPDAYGVKHSEVHDAVEQAMTETRISPVMGGGHSESPDLDGESEGGGTWKATLGDLEVVSVDGESIGKDQGVSLLKPGESGQTAQEIYEQIGNDSPMLAARDPLSHEFMGGRGGGIGGSGRSFNTRIFFRNLFKNRGPSGVYSSSKFIQKNWDRGTFETIAKSVKYHHQKHGSGLSPIQYTQAARQNFRARNDEGSVWKSTTDMQGRDSYRVTSQYGTGLYTNTGRIIWFQPTIPSE